MDAAIVLLNLTFDPLAVVTSEGACLQDLFLPFRDSLEQVIEELELSR